MTGQIPSFGAPDTPHGFTGKDPRTLLRTDLECLDDPSAPSTLPGPPVRSLVRHRGHSGLLSYPTVLGLRGWTSHDGSGEEWTRPGVVGDRTEAPRVGGDAPPPPRRVVPPRRR